MDNETLNALEKIAETACKAKELSDALDAAGFPDSPYFDMYARLADALYGLLHEKTETFEESSAYRILNDDSLTKVERRVLIQATYIANNR